MKAWEVDRGKLRLRDVEPVHAQSGQVQVAIKYAGICGSDLPKLLHPKDFALPVAWRPGHEIVGLDSAGRPIAVDPLIPCKRCPSCAKGSTHLCQDLQRLGWDLPGGFAEQVTTPESNVHPLPRGLDPLHAVLADPAAVAIHGLRCHPIGAPGRMAVLGAGTIGLLTALYAARTGWRVTVIHQDGRPPHPAATQTIAAEFRSTSSIADVGCYDTVVDAATGSSPAPLELALRLVSDGGSVVVQNAYHPNVTLPTALRPIFRRSIRLIGSFSYCRSRQPDDFNASLALLCNHWQQVRHLVHRAGDLADLPATLASRPGSPGRQVLAVKT